MSVAERRAASQIICDRILGIAAYRRAHCVGLYAATDAEVSLDALVPIAISAKKLPCLPRINQRDPRQLEFGSIPGISALRVGRYGIREPQPEAPPLAVNQIDCLCIPALGFDRQGHRLGRGAGYYDQLLAHYHGYRIGVGFACQVVPHVPTDVHDQAMHCVVTETEIITL